MPLSRLRDALARARAAFAPATLAWLLGGCSIVLASACQTAPRPAEMLAVSFATPEATIEAFQLGMRADLPALEFRALSVEFVERHALSELVYREFRQSSGWVRYGVTRARIEGRTDLGPDRARLELSTSGPFGFGARRFEVELVREAFWSAWSGEDRLTDELVEDVDDVLRVEDDGAGPALVVRVPLPYHLDPREGGAPITGLRVGEEWKIADIRQVDSDARGPDSATP